MERNHAVFIQGEENKWCQISIMLTLEKAKEWMESLKQSDPTIEMSVFKFERVMG